MKIYQGDQYAIPFKVKRNGVVQTPDSVSVLEIVLAGIRKTCPGEIVWHENTQQYLFPLNQDDSFSLEEDSYDVLGRAHYTDDTITGWLKIGTIQITGMEGAQEI